MKKTYSFELAFYNSEHEDRTVFIQDTRQIGSVDEELPESALFADFKKISDLFERFGINPEKFVFNPLNDDMPQESGAEALISAVIDLGRCKFNHNLVKYIFHPKEQKRRLRKLVSGCDEILDSMRYVCSEALFDARDEVESKKHFEENAVEAIEEVKQLAKRAMELLKAHPEKYNEDAYNKKPSLQNRDRAISEVCLGFVNALDLDSPPTLHGIAERAAPFLDTLYEVADLGKPPSDIYKILRRVNSAKDPS